MGMLMIGTALILALVAVAVGIVVAMRTPARVRWTRLLICILIADACVTVPLAIWETASLADGAAGASPLGMLLSVVGGTLFDMTSMMLFESRIDSFMQLVSQYPDPFWTGQLYLAVVQLLYVATVALIAYSAYALITSRFALMRIDGLVARANAKSQPIYVFRELSGRTIAFLDDLFAPIGDGRAPKRAGDAPLCIVTNVSKEDREGGSSELEHLDGGPVFVTELDTVAFARHLDQGKRGGKTSLSSMRSLHVFFLEDDESVNLTCAVDFIGYLTEAVPLDPPSDQQMRDRAGELGKELLLDDCAGDELVLYHRTRARFSDGRPRYHVYCACRGKGDELMLDSVPDSQGIDIRMVDEGREVIYDLLHRHPLHGSLARSGLREGEIAPTRDAQDLVVLVVGCGHHGFEAFRACGWLGQIWGARLSIHVIDMMSEDEFRAKVVGECPGFLQTDLVRIYYQSARFEEAGFKCALQRVRNGGILPLVAEGRAREASVPISGDAMPYCIVTAGNDNRSTDVALTIRRVFYGNGMEQVLEPRIHIDLYDQARHRVLKNLRAGDVNGGRPFMLEPFGGIQHIFREGHLVDSDLEDLAFNVNATYEGKLDARLLAHIETVRWTDFDGVSRVGCADVLRQLLFLKYSAWQMNRRSSVMNGLGLSAKLWALGFGMNASPYRHGLTRSEDVEELIVKNSPASAALSVIYGRWRSGRAASEKQADSDLQGPSPSRPAPEGALTLGSEMPPEVEALARVEHDRWMMAYFAEGWMPESVEQSNAYRDLGLNNGRHDSHVFMLHPYLCDFDDLRRVADELGKDDPVRYDVAFIEGIVRLLSDVGCLTGKAYGIASLTTEDDQALSKW